MVGRMPVACQSATRPGVQIRACVRGRVGCSSWRVGLWRIKPCRMALLSEVRSVVWNVRQRRRRVRLFERVRLLSDRSEKHGQLSRGQLRQPDRAEVRDEESFDVLGVG